MRVSELARWLNADYEGDGRQGIREAASIEAAAGHQISFAAGKKAAEMALASGAGCLLVGLDFDNKDKRTVIRVQDPRAAFARVIHLLHPKKQMVGIHPTAVVGDDVSIGWGTSIGPGCVVGDRVTIGINSTVHANVTIYDDVTIGDLVILHSGCVIGADGFGFAMVGDRWEKFPQIGRVEIGDHVEIGANSCIDRAALGVTSIGEGTKLDNMVHVAHNCRIGRHVVVAAQTGFSGGVVVEDYAVVGGQVGVGDKARIESKAVVGSGAGILTSKIVRGGQVVWGTPARPLKQYLEQLANLARLPELREEVKQLRRRLDGLGT